MFRLAFLRRSLLLMAFVGTISGCITTVQVASGLKSPVFCVVAPGDASRLYIVEQGGTIQALDLEDGTLTEVLDISDLVASGNEQGLLGLAFHPEFDTNRKLYVNLTRMEDGATQILEFKAPEAFGEIDPGTASLILQFVQPQSNHNGGWIGFGPDGFLYIASGDGGGGNDDDVGHTAGTGNAQDITENLLGKMLRIDVDGDDFPMDAGRNYAIPAGNPFVGVAGDDEIWAYGLRNPWRCGFDRQTGDLWIGDVGQGQREEIDFQPADNGGGRNYGWRMREGAIATPGVGGPAPAGAIEPVYDYEHGLGQFQGFAVVGGYVYRGPIEELQGHYFFADNVSGKTWSFTSDGDGFDELTDRTGDLGAGINSPASFGEDHDGNLYIVDLDGQVYRVVEQTLADIFGARSRRAK